MLAVAVDAQHGPDQEHARAGRADHVGQGGAQGQEQGIGERFGLEVSAEHDAAGNNVQGAEQHDERTRMGQLVAQGRRAPCPSRVARPAR